MSLYLLIYNKEFKNLTVQQCDTKAQADKLAAEHSGGEVGLVVSEPADLKHFSMHEMVSMYREMTGTSVNRFRDLDSGQKRIFASIKGLVEQASQPKSGEGADPVDSVVVKSSKQKGKKGSPAKSTKGEPKKSGVDRKKYDRINLDGKIEILAKENPRTEQSKAWHSWRVMKPGMLVRTFIKNGGRQADLRHDVKHGRVKILD